MQKTVLFILVLSVSSAWSMEVGPAKDKRTAAIMNLNLLERQFVVGKSEGLIPESFFTNCEEKKQQFPNDAQMLAGINLLIRQAKEINAPFDK